MMCMERCGAWAAPGLRVCWLCFHRAPHQSLERAGQGFEPDHYRLHEPERDDEGWLVDAMRRAGRMR